MSTTKDRERNAFELGRDFERGQQHERWQEEWLPEHCPHWCQDDHKAVALENNDWAMARTHTLHGGEQCLDEIRNRVDGRVMRPGDRGWRLTGQQEPLKGGGFETVETINLVIEDRDLGTPLRTLGEIALTPSEARSLARRLVHLADRMEIG